jgi:DNA adenine methylase
MGTSSDSGPMMVNAIPANRSVRPLLKWAGGKRQLLPQIRRFYPKEFGRYIEPFFGSGAVFFDLHTSGRLRDREVILIDSNVDLVGCYQMVRDTPDRVADEIDRLVRDRRGDGRAQYYAARDERFNPLRERLRQPDGRIAYTPELAALLIYLNRTGFNGLFRLNASGRFNVPAGRYAKPAISSRAQIGDVAAALEHVRLLCGSFDLASGYVSAGDFLYCDPPYAPVSETANFTSYTAAGFDGDDHARLQRFAIDLARRGCQLLISNSTSAGIAALYETNAAAHAAGLRALRVSARRAINSNASRRGHVEEFLITNICA